mgnify:CR=1 FL=1
MLQHGANANVYNQRGLTPLHVQIQQKNIHLIQVMLKYGAKIVPIQRMAHNSSDSRFSLSPFSLTQSSYIQRLLIDSGADLPTFGADLFHSTSDIEMLEHLLKNGIDVDIKNESGSTSLQTTKSTQKFLFLMYLDLESQLGFRFCQMILNFPFYMIKD